MWPLLRRCGAALVATYLGARITASPMTAVLTPCCAWLLWRWLLRVPSLCDDGVGCQHESPVEVRRQACKLHTRWRWCCRRAQQPVSRGIGVFVFGVCLAGARATALIPPSLALIASYGVTYALARVLERSHGAHSNDDSSDGHGRMDGVGAACSPRRDRAESLPGDLALVATERQRERYHCEERQKRRIPSDRYRSEG